MSTSTAVVVGPQDGKLGFLGSIGVRWMIDGEHPEQRFSLIEHPMSPRALAAPLHRHTRGRDPHSSNWAWISGRGVKYWPAPDFVSCAFFSSRPS